jgi:hypothetical protein
MISAKHLEANWFNRISDIDVKDRSGKFLACQSPLCIMKAIGFDERSMGYDTAYHAGKAFAQYAVTANNQDSAMGSFQIIVKHGTSSPSLRLRETGARLLVSFGNHISDGCNHRPDATASRWGNLGGHHIRSFSIVGELVENFVDIGAEDRNIESSLFQF